jgi:C4-dicarboxylate-specific signal transduction histidine kinase
LIDKLNTKKEFLILVIAAIISWLILSKFDAFEYILEYLEQHEEYELDEVLLLFIILGFFSILFAFRRINEATRINKQLEGINKNLKKEVEYQIEERHKKEQLLIQQSKLASLGEMIGNIAHQWRQPLNALGLVVQNIDFAYKMGELNDELMDKSVKKVNLLTKNMSDTIDDFRNFFKPNKESEIINLSSLVKDTLSLVDATFEHHNIKIKGFDDIEILVYGFRNEFSQTLLNILNNAKDAFFDKKMKNPIIDIEVSQDHKYGFVKIRDNAGGIPSSILNKIFDPYFTTKEEGKGTGIGLYMAKIIIEQNMNGKLDVKNINNGAEFTVKIPLYKDKV